MPRPVRLLSIDGGGIQGLAALVIIQELMIRIYGELPSLSSAPRPCEYFDLIVGTGIGGLIAIMLGRLRMSVDEAMQWFAEVASQVFSKKKLLGQGSYKATNLETIIGRMVLKHAGSAGAPMRDNSVTAGDGTCRTTWQNEAPDCTIVQAVRATTARPGLFKPTDISENNIKLSFADAGLGCNNPTEHMLDEAMLVFPGRHVGCIISVGTGQAQPASIPKSRRISWNSSKESTLALEKIATNCEQTAQLVEKRFRGGPDIYFRFNVEQGLQDMGMAELKRLPEVAAHARHYNQLVEVKSKLNSAAHATVSADALVPVAQLGGVIAPALARVQIKPCPPPSIYFTGRSKVLAQIKEYFVGGSSILHVFVLHGLGGSGKTQVALKFVEEHRDCFCDVFYVDASSAETISTDLKRIAMVKQAGNTQDDALTWLAGQDKKWLIVFNNADNTSMDLKQYFPTCSAGNILITTRNRQMINLAGQAKPGVKAECHISGLEPDDAKELLFKVSDLDPNNSTENYVAILVKEFGYLALAIIQAGAYIRVTECTPQDYLEMYLENKKILEEYKKLVPKCDDYGWTVYTTWLISYNGLKPEVAQFLRLLGFMHHEGITENILRNACERLSAYELELSTDQDSPIKQTVTNFLRSSFCKENNGFNKAAFLDFIRELRSYSLIEFNDSDQTYSFHPLLQDWVRRIDEVNCSTARSSTALLLALSVRYESDICFPCSQGSLLPHIDTVLADLEVMPCTANSFAWVYQQNNLWEAAEPLLNVSLKASSDKLGKTHPTTLYNIENLATTLSRQERWSEAETLRSGAIETCKQALGTDHAYTLWAMSNLALHHSRRKQFQKAKELQLSIIDAKIRTAGLAHVDTLQAIGNLAMTYVDLDQLEMAERLQKLVSERLQHLAGPQHPITLTSKQHLAFTYAKRKKWGDFKAVQTELVQTRSVVLGKDHFATRESIAILDWFDQNITIPNTPPEIIIYSPTTSPQENGRLLQASQDCVIVSESDSDELSDDCSSLYSVLARSEETVATSVESLHNPEVSTNLKPSNDPWMAKVPDWYMTIERIPEQWVREQLRQAVAEELRKYESSATQNQSRGRGLEKSQQKHCGLDRSLSREKSPSRMSHVGPDLDSWSNIQTHIDSWREWLNLDTSEANSIRTHKTNPPQVITLVDPFSPDSPIYGRVSSPGPNVPQPRSPLLPKL
ncbi:hypothetical protein FRC07_003053, partial [Ceratobasidium sp. 392]